jgi:Tol biopolymer transport system component
MVGSIPSSDVAAQLERVLASATFRTAERSCRLLRFVVEQTLQGQAERLKDYTLGAEALGRGDDFDPRTDPIARVEMGRLRSRLEVYYATEGAADEIRIAIPKGGYVPTFEPRATSTQGNDSASVWPPWRWSAVWPPVAAAAVAAAVTWWVGVHVASSGTHDMRVELMTPSTTDPASLAISPDGLSVTFVATRGGVSALWLRAFALGEADAHPLPGTESASLPFWEPRGHAIGFFAEGKIKAIDLRTRVVRTMCTAWVPAGASWNSDGVILYTVVPEGTLVRMSDRDPCLTETTRLKAGQTGHRSPTFLPDGRHFLFYAAGNAAVRGVYLGELGTFDTKRIVDADAAAGFLPPAQLLYVQHGRLFAQRFDLPTATVSGDPLAIADLGMDPTASLAVSASSGVIAYRGGPVGQLRQLTWLDRHGNELRRIGASEERGYIYGSISPDGRRLAVQRRVNDNVDIYILDLERGTFDPFTTEPQADIAPMWSPLGDRIAYSSQSGDTFELFEKPLKGGEPQLLLPRTHEAKQITDWSRDGRYILYRTVTTPAADMDIWAVALDGDRTPFALVKTPFEERDAVFSPDAKWIAYQSNVSGRPEVYIQLFKPGAERVLISLKGGLQPQWRADGRELFYLTPEGDLMAVPIDYGPDGSPSAGAETRLFQTRLGAIQGIAMHSYAVTQNGQRFLLDVMVEQQAAPIFLILNWTRQ